VNTSDLARAAVRAAARARADLGVGPAEAVCPFDLAEGLEVPVRLIALPSLEGMYSPVPKPTIVVSVERPAGRRRYTCGHEIGHHIFGHGTRLDELADDAAAPWNPEEFIAQRFAAALLMPSLAIDSAFARRGCPAAAATAEMVFVVAQELGVGFTTLVGHLERTLERLPYSRADALRRVRLPVLREKIAGLPIEHDLVVIDAHWRRRTVDVEAGDIVVLRAAAEFQGKCASLIKGSIRYLVAERPGIGQLLLNGCEPPVSVRVSRRGFTGIARYRHLEEAPDDK
jgi:IrrE N-terminal-like domain